MSTQSDLVRFLAYTQEAAEMDCGVGTVLRALSNVPLVGEFVDIDFQE